MHSLWKKPVVFGMMMTVFFGGQSMAEKEKSFQTPFSESKGPSCHSLFFQAKMIAEEPYDQMGQDYQNTFAAFVEKSVAGPENLKSLALQAFELRMQISKKYHSFFVQDTQVHNPWFLRWMGFGNRRTLGIALKGTPRGDSIIETVDSVLKLNDLFIHSHGQKRSVLFLSEVSGEMGSPIPVQWGRRQDKNFVMVHPRNEEIPLFLNYCEQQWKIALNRTLPAWRRAEALARFEWHWFWANPLGRAGAITGDALSLIVQKQALQEGWLLSIRQEFQNQDLIAMRNSLEDYTLLRLQDWGISMPISEAKNNL